MTTLEEKQRAMKARHSKKVRIGKPRRQAQAPVFDQERFRRRIAALHLLLSGFSVSQVAVRLNVNVKSVAEWKKRGCPMLWHFVDGKCIKSLRANSE